MEGNPEEFQEHPLVVGRYLGNWGRSLPPPSAVSAVATAADGCDGRGLTTRDRANESRVALVLAFRRTKPRQMASWPDFRFRGPPRRVNLPLQDFCRWKSNSNSSSVSSS